MSLGSLLAALVALAAVIMLVLVFIRVMKKQIPDTGASLRLSKATWELQVILVSIAILAILMGLVLVAYVGVSIICFFKL